MNGYFYVIQLLPEAYPQRLKFGFSNNPKRRLGMHRTAAPTAKLLGSWPCPRSEERNAIQALAANLQAHRGGGIRCR